MEIRDLLGLFFCLGGVNAAGMLGSSWELNALVLFSVGNSCSLLFIVCLIDVVQQKVLTFAVVFFFLSAIVSFRLEIQVLFFANFCLVKANGAKVCVISGCLMCLCYLVYID